MNIKEFLMEERCHCVEFFFDLTFDFNLLFIISLKHFDGKKHAIVKWTLDVLHWFTLELYEIYLKINYLL